MGVVDQTSGSESMIDEIGLEFQTFFTNQVLITRVSELCTCIFYFESARFYLLVSSWTSSVRSRVDGPQVDVKSSFTSSLFTSGPKTAQFIQGVSYQSALFGYWLTHIKVQHFVSSSNTFGLGLNHMRLHHFHIILHVKCCSLMQLNPKPNVAL